MSTMIPFISKLLQKESLRKAFVADAEQLLAKHDLTPEDKKLLLQIAKSGTKAAKTTNGRDAKDIRSKNRDRLLGALSKELSSRRSAGGPFDPHW